MYFCGMQLEYSFVIPVFNRPEEVRELLKSFLKVTFPEPFEIVIVEDGSTETSEGVVQEFAKDLSISYYYKENSGPGDSRNFGMRKAKGNYFIILDSDVLMPHHYLVTVNHYLKTSYYDCYGGADAAHTTFSNLQKAINYVMTSFITTGGIRGRAKSVARFEPRSFNMGISKKAFEATGGYARIHPGEDPDLSQRILQAGYQTTFIPNAAVFHKRRISWSKFYQQVKKFGTVRPILNRWHPRSAKLAYWFPSLFILFVLLSVISGSVFHWVAFLPMAAYTSLVFLGASVKNRSLFIGMLSVVALYVQFFGYGLAFLKSTFYIGLLKKDPEKQFPHLFFK